MLAVDPFAFFFKIVILLSAILIVVFSLGSAELNSPGRKLGEYYALLVALTLGHGADGRGQQPADDVPGARALVASRSYILAGYTREAPDSSEASLKYVIYGAFSSGLMLYGISIIYGLTGSLGHLHDQPASSGGPGRRRVSSTFALLIAGVLIAGGLRLQDLGGAVPLLGPGRVRRRADHDHGVSVRGLEGRRVRHDDPVLQGDVHRHAARSRFPPGPGRRCRASSGSRSSPCSRC